MDIRDYNRRAWDHQVEAGNQWTIPVTPQEVAEARQGRWGILLTPSKPVPGQWFPPLEGLNVLCLASGGGQQGPILAAAGARVTVFDNSPRQLERDRTVAQREGLEIATVEGDMRDLSAFKEGEFELIVHPTSNLFVPQVRPVWREAYRVLAPGGVLLAGFNNPVRYIFDFELLEEQGLFEVRYPLPYSDLEQLEEEKREKLIQEGSPLEFSHTLDDQIGGQLEAGFVITDFYEDRYQDYDWDPLSRIMPSFIATRAVKA
jgi:SAM-dependent methyltransferase